MRRTVRVLAILLAALALVAATTGPTGEEGQAPPSLAGGDETATREIDVLVRVDRPVTGDPQGGPETAARGSLAWTSASSVAGRGAAALRVAVDGAGTYRLSVPVDGPGTLSAEVAGYWAAEKLVLPGQGEASLLLVPTGTLEAAVEVPSGTSVPASLELELGPASFLQARAPNPAARLAGTVGCPVEEGRLRCEVPAGRHDLRWHAPGFASVLRWDVEVVPRRRQALEPIVLVPGGAVLGFVEVSRQAPPPETPEREVRVTLTVASEEVLEYDTRRRLGYSRQETAVGPGGAFQFGGLAPGRYRLVAEADGLAAATQPVVEVFEGRESRLSTPLLLEPLADQEVRVLPPAAPDGGPWHVRLAGLTRGSAGGLCTTGPAGDCRITRLAAGEYRLVVEDAAGSAFHDHSPILVSHNPPPLEVELPLVAVEGEITRGGEPARARLIFHRGPGAERVETYSDHGGRFTGHVPAEGEWHVAAAMEAHGSEVGLGTVDVVRPGDGSAFPIRLELPNTTLLGTVLDAAGRPEPRARVTAYSQPGRPPSDGVTDRQGRFRMWGLEEGSYRVRATVSGRAATGGPVEVREDAVVRVEVRLPGVRELRGRVTADGVPLTGATVVVVPELPPERGGVQDTVVSGLGGLFRARIPEGTPAVHLVVLPPGLAALVLRVPVGSDGTVEVAVQRWGGTLELKDPSGLRLGHGLQHGLHEGLHRGASRVWLAHLSRWPALFGLPTRLDAETFVLPQMTPGPYRLCSPDGRRCAEGTLTAGGHLVLELAGGGFAEPDFP